MSILKFNPNNELWKTFWIQGVLFSQILWGIFAYLRWGMEPISKLMIYPYMLILLAYTAWICWRILQAGRTAQDPNKGIMAQYLTVAWALNSVLILGVMAGHIWNM